MLFNHAGSYAEAYHRSAGTKRLLQNPTAMLTDRGAYLTYLESQLERVTAACLTVGGLQEHITDVQIEVQCCIVRALCCILSSLLLRVLLGWKIGSAHV